MLRWFSKEKYDNSFGKGIFTLKDGELNFKLQSRFGIISYQGKFTTDGCLMLSSSSLTNGYSSVGTYRIVETESMTLKPKPTPKLHFDFPILDFSEQRIARLSKHSTESIKKQNTSKDETENVDQKVDQRFIKFALALFVLFVLSVFLTSLECSGKAPKGIDNPGPSMLFFIFILPLILMFIFRLKK